MLAIGRSVCAFPPSLFSAPANFRHFLTSSQAITALRPFYFKVHPDLFCRFPAEQNHNEESLKMLNEHIKKLHDKRPAKPLLLTFYLRHHHKHDASLVSSLEKVQFDLVATSIVDLIRYILKTCSLSLEYLDSLKPPVGYEGRILFNSSLYHVMGGYQEKDQNQKPHITLSYWLTKNIELARSKQKANMPIKLKAISLVEEMKQEYAIKDLRWNSSWGLSQFCACIRKLRTLFIERQPDLKDMTIVFADESGISVHSEIILSVRDVPDHWMNVLCHLESEKEIYTQLADKEKQLGDLLNNIQIVRDHDWGTPASKYSRQLDIMLHALRSFQTEILRRDWSKLKIKFEWVTGAITISPRGYIIVPGSCPAFLLIDFIENNYQSTVKMEEEHLKYQEANELLMNRVLDEFNLSTLKRDVSISRAQMTSCCERLLSEDPRNVPMTLQGINLRVAGYYSVMADGEICILWSWYNGF